MVPYSVDALVDDQITEWRDDLAGRAELPTRPPCGAWHRVQLHISRDSPRLVEVCVAKDN